MRIIIYYQFSIYIYNIYTYTDKLYGLWAEFMKHEQNKFRCKYFLNHSYINCHGPIQCDNSCKNGFMNCLQGHLFCVFNEGAVCPAVVQRKKFYCIFLKKSPCQQQREATFGCAIVHCLTGGIFRLDFTLNHVHLFGDRMQAELQVQTACP